MNTCTVAESINVTYTVDVDPAAAAANPALAGLIQTATGTVTTSAKLIFGNDPR
ncbi:MAG: hypothetical protein ACXVCD_18395 [Pseudobdellovibrionaceae bacterium]